MLHPQLPPPRYLLTATVLVAAWLLSFRLGEKTPPAPELPHLLDPRLELTLFAEEPDIVTPIGIAIDRQSRIFVLESHTHLPPAHYPGPKDDRIKVLTDRNHDGQPDSSWVFAEGFKEGLNLAFSPEGHLYLVTSRAVWVLYDRDGDGICEEKKRVLELTEPASVYAHAALLGITFSSDGWMYVSRGNTSGAAWQLVGTDGTSLRGYGDGGNIVRARPDGSHLEEVATGFWNPMDLKFDAQGRLLAADNDPDSRGPNRLLHILPGGDYGYQSLYGGSGIHPYLAWNGELPGTLPYAVGLGEAPSGLLDASLAALPTDYQGQLLTSIWEESRVVRVGLRPQGASVTGSTEVLIQGGPDFRPVAFATDPAGTIYFTDWVLRDYPNHGRGRIWRLAARPSEAVAKPRSPYEPAGPPSEGTLLQAIQSSTDFEALTKYLSQDDPFVRHAAVMALARPEFRPRLITATQSPEPAVRLGVLLALQRLGTPPADDLLTRLLADPDARVRQRVLLWIGRAGLTALRPELDRALAGGTPSPALFETYLETIRHLDPAFITAYRSRAQPYAKSIPRNLPPHFLESFVRDRARPSAWRALALRMLEKPETQLELLTALLTEEQDPALRLEAVRSLAQVPSPAVAALLGPLARQTTQPVLLRAEALLALSRQPTDLSAEVVPLLQDPSPEVQLEAARYLRTYAGTLPVRKALQKAYADGKTQEPLKQQLALALALPDRTRPGTLAAWEQALTTTGDAQRGRRVFYSVRAVCSACHAVEGRGGALGPDLTHVGQSKSRSQLIRAILRPSEEISPEWQGWYVRLHSGETHQGRQIDVGDRDIELYTQGAGFRTFLKKDIQDYGLITTSLMPDGLEQQLSVSDLRDLLAFLEAKK
ncbi:c-type cytochrome [Rhabdobacter roseus]|uniref:Cytochrome c domain-containing protein n=1 Tax=Rhabdobacter roseus TaxID=1655419 RepID=A0A840U002_9BACT|nr:PVC-type heme-binding CxxCH protein [Rhabdobacter roseus]MBB5286863.1 hypothetical protein [Rhabdobacter roseus]